MLHGIIFVGEVMAFVQCRKGSDVVGLCSDVDGYIHTWNNSTTASRRSNGLCAMSKGFVGSFGLLQLLSRWLEIDSKRTLIHQVV